MSKLKFDSVGYKKRTIKIWNEVAPRYHKRWANTDNGPFQSTEKLVEQAKIKEGDFVLDIACGTGVVTKKIIFKIGKNGMVIGLDISKEAIKIAKKFNSRKNNLDFVLADAETLNFKEKFDVITCQYALFFFPNSQKVLCNAKRFLKRNGTLALSVHGHNVPFFNSILKAITKFVPDYIPLESPDLDRFGTKHALKNEIKKSGFSKIKINEYVFTYSPGTFSDYWNNYLKYIANPLKEKLNKLSLQQRKNIKDLAAKNTIPYTRKDGTIIFPWQVLVLTAKK